MPDQAPLKARRDAGTLIDPDQTRPDPGRRANPALLALASLSRQVEEHGRGGGVIPFPAPRAGGGRGAATRIAARIDDLAAGPGPRNGGLSPRFEGAP